MKTLALLRGECRVVVRDVSGVGRPSPWISSQVASTVLRRRPCNGKLSSLVLATCAVALSTRFGQRKRPHA